MHFVEKYMTILQGNLHDKYSNNNASSQGVIIVFKYKIKQLC